MPWTGYSPDTVFYAKRRGGPRGYWAIERSITTLDLISNQLSNSLTARHLRFLVSICDSFDFCGEVVYSLGPRSHGSEVRALDSSSHNEVTQLLARWRQGDATARDALVPLVYDELRRLARRCLAGQQRPTLQSTALVHEAYLRLVRQPSLRAENRSHFLAIAARLMREILVDHARSRGAAKRGANGITLTFDEAVALPQRREMDLVSLDHALNSLAAMDPRQSQIVDLRFFGGLSIEETSEVLEISPATVKREWTCARLWLHRELRGSYPA